MADPDMSSSTTPTVAQEDNASQSSALDRLLTADQSILLNTVDKLRHQGVSKYIKLPQIIVCGDQSSGKSSVLEAISHISFPRDGGICTTFPTELSLRRAPNRAVKVQLKPSTSRPDSEKTLLASYQQEASNLSDFEPLVRKAKEHLRNYAGKDRKVDSFFEDILYVEVTDPKWPPLSLVDLPGLISAPNPNQTSEDVTIVHDLVSRYMENPKSIILAVISASYELPLQKVFSLIKKYDPLGERTICVVTKPDNAVPGPNDLPQFVEYVQNKLPGYHFELGWHVVKNREQSAQDQTLDERDKAEKDFFTQAAWSGRLQRNQIGINKLRDRLSVLLERHIRSEMSGILKQIEETLDESNDELFKLGPARSTSEAQRLYLVTLSQRFERLVSQAMNGYYDDSSFFLSDLPRSNPRRLRAALRNLNQDFAKRMHERGHAKKIANDLGNHSLDWPKGKSDLQFNNPLLPETIYRRAYIQHIKSLSEKNWGNELIGSPNLRLVGDLFRDQSRRWRALTTEHLEIVLQCVNDHLSIVSENVTTPDTSAALRREVLYGAVEKRQRRMMEKLEELLKPYEKGHPVTYDFSYIVKSRELVKDDVRARLEEYKRRCIKIAAEDGTNSDTHGLQIRQVISALKLGVDEVEDVDCADILNCMQAYYDGALRTFIDNVAVLAIEGCLVDSLNEIFNATAVANMDEETLRRLAGESEHAQAERQELEQKVAALEDAHKECRRAGVSQGPRSALSNSVQLTAESKTGGLFGSANIQPAQSIGGGFLGSTNVQPAQSTGGGLFGSSSAFGSSNLQSPKNSSGNLPPFKPLDNSRILSYVQHEGGLLNIYQMLPLYINDFMSFEELHLLEQNTQNWGTSLILLENELNQHQPIGKKFTSEQCAELMTIQKA